MFQPRAPLRIAVVGAGVSGLSAAWLLSQRHEVVLYEADPRLGGHAHTVEAPSPRGPRAVDTGFIVYNEANYPTLSALFRHLDVPTKPAYMSFSVSMDGGALEYASQGLTALFAQKRNLAKPQFWGMLRDLVRFQFYMNHRLLEIDVRPTWRTVDGGSREYVSRLIRGFAGRVAQGRPVVEVIRSDEACSVRTADGEVAGFDHVVRATHSDQALRLLDAPTPDEQRLLSAIAYRPNRAVLHRDRALMPRRRAAWAAWTHLGRSDRAGEGGVTYWMNRLQGIDGPDLFVSLNPLTEPDPKTVLRDQTYEHPVFDAAAVAAQKDLWSLQGVRRTWYCGAWFGWGFHEDGLQAGLAVAEHLGGVRRPWQVEGESGRITLPAAAMEAAA